MRWLEAEAKRDPRLAEALPTVRASLRRWHKAREIVVERNLRLAGSVVMRRFSHLPMSQDDMLQEAVFGLSHAADRFDPNYGVKFSTYATWWIRHAVQRAMQNTLRLVRIPAHLCDRIARYASAIGELGDRADVSEIATKIGEPVESTRKLAALYRTRAAPAMSLDEPAKTRPSHASDRGDPASARIDLLPAETPDLDEEISHEELARAVRVMIRDLPERSRKILAMRFGLDGEPATLERVGAHFGLTRERIRQIEKMAIRALSAKVPRALCTTSRV